MSTFLAPMNRNDIRYHCIKLYMPLPHATHILQVIRKNIYQQQCQVSTNK